MSDATSRRSLFLIPIALGVVALFVIPFVILLRGYLGRPAADTAQQAEVEAVRRGGGVVLTVPSDESGKPPDVRSVDLGNATVDAELMKTISRLATVERLRLDGATLQPEDYALLSKLPQLHNLSLSRTNVTDTDVARLPLSLTSLSLDSTSVTDECVSRLAAMNRLVRLEITDTKITPDGLRQLEPLRSLERLWIDDSCITAESAESLQLMQLQRLDVAVLEGVGRETHEFLSVCEGPKIRGHHRDGYVLWEADSAWSDTLAGVVEAVVSEIGLDSQQAARLLEILGEENPPMGNWGPIVLGPLPESDCFSSSSHRPDKGMEITCTDEFIRELQKPFSDVDPWAVRRFAREEFTASDVPKLLAAIRAAQPLRGSCLLRYGPFLLVRHGIGEPDVVAELERLLTHKEPSVTCATIFALGYGRARDFYSRDEWTSSKEADEFAVSRLLRICNDEDEYESLRSDARMVLAEIALGRPEYADDVMPALVELLDEEGFWHIIRERH